MLDTVSWIFLALGGVTGLIILSDVIRHPQPMTVMNVTSPITGLYFPLLGLAFYRQMGRAHAAGRSHNMGQRSPGQALIDAIKADALSLVAFEVGMFGWMAVAALLLLDGEPAVSGPVFWFMMQIAMMLGFATAYPANWLLVRRGIKHAL